MRIAIVAATAAVSLLAGCAHHDMNHAAMSHEEMMQHCHRMEEHAQTGGHDASHHDPAQHGGMTHEEMQRRCEAMRAEHQTGPAPHQH